MTEDLKIYYNNSFVLLTANRQQMNKNFATILTDEKEIEKFFNTTETLFDGKTNDTILVITDAPDKVLQLFRERVKLILAGGGIVFNERDELLMIHRRGHWDLAKGKIEKGEAILDGAIREVEEETGVQIEHADETPIYTYHAYTLKGKQSLKQTSWYPMKAKPGQDYPIPQVEEDIEQVRWVAKTDLKGYESGCYLLIWDLIQQAVLKA